MLRSRLLVRLDGSIAKARNPVDLACLRAERAAFLARQGHLVQARKSIELLQTQFAWRPHAAVSAWLSLAEGLLDYYSNLGVAARDRIQRAYALSGAAQLAPLHALSAAWLAQMDYVRNDMAQMAQHVAQALQAAEPAHHSARSRACLVVAVAYHFAGALDRALPWYTRSRVHATADGDEAHLSALMHNQAALRGSQARLAQAFGGSAEDPSLRHALMATESIGHFDAGVGTASLGSLVPMLRAQILAGEGRHAEALALFDEHLDTTRAHGLGRQHPCFLADMAWCRLQLGDVDGARGDAVAADAALKEPCDIDDRAMAQARLADVLLALGDEAAGRTLRERAERDLQAYRGEQARLVGLLDETLRGVDVSVA